MRIAIILIPPNTNAYKFTNTDNRAAYIAMGNSIPGIAGSIAPLIGGWLAGAISYQAMFIIAAVIGTASWALLRFAVREPRKISLASI